MFKRLQLVVEGITRFKISQTQMKKKKMEKLTDISKWPQA